MSTRFAYKSPKVSNVVLGCGYKKSVRTCHAHQITGIAKHHQGNEQKNKYPTLFVYTLQSTAWGRTRTIIYKNRMSVFSVSTPLLKIGDFTM